MIDIKKLYGATNYGLEIIKGLYPQAEVGKKFRVRESDDDKTPSSSLQKRKIKVKGVEIEVWGLTDFGGDGSWRNPIDLYMLEKGKSQEQFFEALQELAQNFNVCETVDAKKNIPRMEYRPALPEKKNGTRTWNVKEQASDADLLAMGRTVKQETLDALGWKALNWITYTKDGQTTIKYSTENYPIFIRECVIKEKDDKGPAQKFYKIYEPLNADKKFRFGSYPAGEKPENYIHGIHELVKEYQQYNAKRREEFEANEKNKDKKYQEVKLPCAVICSGDRDALACRSMGVPPIWLNSETAKLEESAVKQVFEYVNALYNIPDIDETGIREGKKLALNFLDIKTVWLPQGLRKFRDHRGKPRKDLNDWIDLHPKRDEFYALLKTAKTAKFYVKNDKGAALDTANLHYFLQLNGFATYEDETCPDEVQLIRINGYEVSRVFPVHVRRFLRQWVSENVKDHDVINLVLNTTRISASGLEGMRTKTLVFNSSTPTSQTFFFTNQAVTITGSEITPVKREDYRTQFFVWSDNVIQHKFQMIKEDFFTVNRTNDSDGQPHFQVIINKVASNLMGYFINSSRLYWREEMEVPFNTKAERDAYAAGHKFDLRGEGLSDEQIYEQELTFLNKVFAAGYMLHSYKDRSKPWAPYAMDNSIGEEGQRNGGTGKSLFFTALEELIKTVTISGKEPKIFENDHTFEEVKPQTKMVVIDDCAKSLDIERFYDRLTGKFRVNPKGKTIFTLNFSESPKMAFTTNYVPSSFDPSNVRRLLFMVFSDYYHQKTEDNDYLETRSVSDDFGKNLLPPDATYEEWNADINFLLQCERFYLSVCHENMMIVPPMKNISTRRSLTVMGDTFYEWASSYFAVDSGRLNTYIPRDEAFTSCKQYTNMKEMLSTTFKKKLEHFVKVTDWIDEMNPLDKCNGDENKKRRRIKKNGVEYIYLSSSADGIPF